MAQLAALKALRAQLPAGSRAVHLGATSQDVVDSALMVMVGRVGAILAEDLAAAQDALEAVLPALIAAIEMGRPRRWIAYARASPMTA